MLDLCYKRLVITGDAEPAPVISPKIMAVIASSPRLKRRLFPQSLFLAPYRVLDYDATLVLRDKKGSVATFQRVEKVEFQQDGVRAILDHFWGDGVTVAEYRNTAGWLGDSLRDEGRRHLIIGLKQPASRGQVLTFQVERTAMTGFTQEHEWLETTLNHPAERLTRSVIFPKGRPCRAASLFYEDRVFPLRVKEISGGRTQVGVRITRPKHGMPYVVRWAW